MSEDQNQAQEVNEQFDPSAQVEGQETAVAETQQTSTPVAGNLATVKFNFKARNITDEDGKVIGKTKKQPPLVVGLPKPTPDYIAQILALPDEVVPEVKNAKGEVTTPAGTKFPKIKQYILDTIFDGVVAQAKAQLDEHIEGFGQDETKTVSADLIDYDKLNLEYIANLEPSQRGQAAIPEEDFKAMYEDYIAVMVKATGKELKRLQAHVDIFAKPTKIRTNKDAQKVLLDQLEIYRSTSTAYASEDTQQVTDRIYARLEKWYKEDATAILGAL